MRPFIGRWIRFSSIFPHLCRLIQHYQGTLFTFCQSDCRLAYKNNEFHGFRFLYSIVNFIILATAVTWKADYFLLCANLCCIVFANLYLFYSLKVEDDKNSMEFQIEEGLTVSLSVADLLTLWNLPFGHLESGSSPRASEFPYCAWSLPPTSAHS